MSVATKPTEQHGAKAHSDGGWDSTEGAFVPVQTRSGRFTSVDHADFAPVTGREIEWKLTPVARVKVLLDDELDGSPYDIDVDAGAGASVEWVDRAIAGSAGQPEERASANAWTHFDKALAITSTGAEHADIVVRRERLGAVPRAAHTVITATKGSSATVIIESHGSAVLSENVEIIVEDDATLTVVSLQEWSDDALHLASHFVTVGHGARLKHIVVSLGGSVVRVNPSVHLAGEGADAELYGLYFADAGQHLEQRVYLHHVAPNTRGRVNYKGALQGVGARAVWVGDVLIGPDASGTDSYEQNRNLVLSEGTRADS
jgi:Fe-S cluster assembly protein SufD